MQYFPSFNEYLLTTYFLPGCLPNADGTAMNKILCLHGAYVLLEGERQGILCQMVISAEKKNTKKAWVIELGKEAILNMNVQREALFLLGGIFKK